MGLALVLVPVLGLVPALGLVLVLVLVLVLGLVLALEALCPPPWSPKHHLCWRCRRRR